jgi:NADP-dependent aldehyde dehydrogenase
MSMQQVLIDGQWRASAGTQTFQPVNPATEEAFAEQYPISPWPEIEHAIESAHQAFEEVKAWPGERFAAFLEAFAKGVESRTDTLVALANAETALPLSPRLKEGELPRTLGQLRQAAQAAASGSWTRPTLDTKANIRSMLGPIGPVVVMGPNNFPFAFNSIAGGDFAAAVAAGNPVIAKGHPSHPGTTKLFAEAAWEAATATKMPSGFVQLIYRTTHEDGARLVSHPLVAATGYTGSRHAGLALKEAADRAGKPIYLELSSINPVYILPGALSERSDALADEFTGSCLMGTGQFCTNPGLVVLLAGDSADAFIQKVAQRFQAAPVGTLLNAGVRQSFAKGLEALRQAGAKLIAGGNPDGGKGVSFQNTLLRVSGKQFLDQPAKLQTEAFGNGSLFVVADDERQMADVARCLEGNLTGGIYSHSGDADEDLYQRIAPVLSQRVGRLLNDKMPTGVAVTEAMNHGGPYPATGHAGFTAVGLPRSIERFTMLKCYDNVRPNRLPAALKNKNPTGKLWRLFDGQWTTADVG